MKAYKTKARNKVLSSCDSQYSPNIHLLPLRDPKFEAELRMTEQAALKIKNFQLVRFLCFPILMDNKLVEGYNSFRDMRKMTENKRYGLKKRKNCQPLNIKREKKKAFHLASPYLLGAGKTFLLKSCALNTFVLSSINHRKTNSSNKLKCRPHDIVIKYEIITKKKSYHSISSKRTFP